jgi:hypothetical protein
MPQIVVVKFERYTHSHMRILMQAVPRIHVTEGHASYLPKRRSQFLERSKPPVL